MHLHTVHIAAGSRTCLSPKIACAHSRHMRSVHIPPCCAGIIRTKLTEVANVIVQPYGATVAAIIQVRAPLHQ